MNLKLGTDGDIEYKNGAFQTVRGADFVKQNIEARLRTFYGEWFLDESIGVPYFQDVLVKNPDLTVLNAIFTKVIVETPGVRSLNELNFELFPDRSMKIFIVGTIDEGELELSFTLDGV